MAFDDLYVISTKTTPATPQELMACEADAGCELPPDYVAFVGRLGEGAISNWVRVYGPARVARDRADRRAGLEQYYFWDEGADVLSRDQVKEALMLADTFNGDEVVYRASEPAGFFALPRDEEGIYAIGETLEQAIDWLCTSGTLTGALRFKAFEPMEGRQFLQFSSTDGATFEAVRDGLHALGAHDAAVDSTEGDSKCYDLYYRDFGGSVAIVEGEDGAVAFLRADADAAGATFERVVETLEELGLSET